MQSFKTIDEYIAQFPKDVQEKLEKMRRVIHESVPNLDEAISYGMPTFKLKGKNVVHFAAYKSHIGFYPTPNGLEAFAQDLKMYQTSKGTAQFQLTEPIPFDLVKKITKFRAEQVLGK